MNTITSQIFYQHFLSGLQQNLQAELTDSDQISSGKQISKPSDDPAGLWKVVDYQTQISEIGEYQQAITSAKDPIDSLDSALSTLTTTLNRANELATSAVGGSNDAEISPEVQQLLQSAVSTANTQVDGNYVFGGFQSDVAPIDTSTNEFVSDTNSVNIGIAAGIDISTNLAALNGDNLFSFKRVNATDSAQNITPLYNSTNNGANTIPDADPASALVTAAGSPSANFASGTSTSGASVAYGAAPSTFVSSGDVYSANGGSLDVTVGTTPGTSSGGFVINGTNDTINVNGVAQTIPSGIYTGANLAAALSAKGDGVGFTYNSSSQEFTITGGAVGGLVVGNTYSGADLATALSTVNNGVNFSYTATNHEFSVTGAGQTINFTPASSSISTITGFSGTGSQTLSSTAVTGTAVGDVNLAAGSTLQDVRDAFNTADAGVKAQVVNVDTTGKNPDYRLVVAYDPATYPSASSSDIDIKVLSTTDASGTGVNMLSYDSSTGQKMTLETDKISGYNYFTDPTTANDSIVIDDGSNGNIANDQIVVNVGGTQETATIARGTYTNSGENPPLASDLSVAVQKALNTAAANAGDASNGFSVSYDRNTRTYTIKYSGAENSVSVLWSNASSTATQLLGYNTTDPAVNIGTAGAVNSVTSDSSVVDNYYSFNNNYLNDKYVLRALNFENQSLLHSDSGRIGQSLQYMNDLTSAVSQAQAVVGARENELNNEGTYQTNSSTNMQTFLSAADDTDIAKVASDLSQRETTLQALRTVSAQVLNESLFDFLKLS